MTIQLKTLTPLHIGNGEELHPLDYVTYQRGFYRISQKQFETFLTTCGVKDIEIAFADWAIETADTIDNLKEKADKSYDRRDKMDYNQQQSNLKKQFNYLNFTQKQNIEKKFIDYIRQNIIEVGITAPDLANRK